jgi:outer membrane murein-binding lipoprotein Lpp
MFYHSNDSDGKSGVASQLGVLATVAKAENGTSASSASVSPIVAVATAARAAATASTSHTTADATATDSDGKFEGKPTRPEPPARLAPEAAAASPAAVGALRRLASTNAAKVSTPIAAKIDRLASSVDGLASLLSSLSMRVDTIASQQTEQATTFFARLTEQHMEIITRLNHASEARRRRRDKTSPPTRIKAASYDTGGLLAECIGSPANEADEPAPRSTGDQKSHPSELATLHA